MNSFFLCRNQCCANESFILKDQARLIAQLAELVGFRNLSQARKFPSMLPASNNKETSICGGSPSFTACL